MDNKLLEEINAKLKNIMPDETEIDAGFYNVKFYRRNNPEKAHICIQNPCVIFVSNGEKHTYIGNKIFIFKKAPIILHILITLYPPIFTVYQKIIHTFLFIFQLIII